MGVSNLMLNIACVFVYRDVMMAIVSRSSLRCRVWCKARSKDWWEAVSAGKLGSEWWRENLRMEKATFDIICREIRPYIQKEVCEFSPMYLVYSFLKLST